MAKPSVIPLRDRVLIEPSKAEEKTAGGIVLPDTAKEKPKQGKVIAVGAGKPSDDGTIRPLAVKKGDKVLYGSFAGTEIKAGAETYLIMSEDDILAIIE
jgi:chaperonin GroES